MTVPSFWVRGDNLSVMVKWRDSHRHIYPYSVSAAVVCEIYAGDLSVDTDNILCLVDNIQPLPAVIPLDVTRLLMTSRLYV